MMRFLLLAAFLYYLSVVFQVRSPDLEPVSQGTPVRKELDLVGFHQFHSPADSFFLRSDVTPSERALIRLATIVCLEKLSESGAARYLLLKILGYQNWYEVFDRFSLSLWKEEEKFRFLLALPWSMAPRFNPLFEPEELLEPGKDSDWTPKQWNSSSQLFLRKNGDFLLISDSNSRRLDSPATIPHQENQSFFYSDDSALKLFNLPGDAWIESVEGRLTGSEKKSRIQFVMKMNDSRRSEKWLGLLKGGQRPFPWNERDLVQIFLSIPGFISQPEIQKRLVNASPKKAPALSWIAAALAGKFTIHGFREDGRPHGTLTASFHSPGDSAQAIQKIESLLQRKGGVLSDLDEGRRYSVTIPFLPISLFLSRTLEQLGLSTTPNWNAPNTVELSRPGFFHGSIQLDKISNDFQRGMKSVKEQYHVRKLRQCLQIRRLETGVFRFCPLGQGFENTPDGLICPLHGTMRSPGSRAARERDHRFQAFIDFLEAYKSFYFRASVSTAGIELLLMDQAPGLKKPAHNDGL